MPKNASKQPQPSFQTRGVRPGHVRMAPGTWNPDERSFEVVLATDTPVKRGYFFPYIERFSMDPAHIRLVRINSGIVPFIIQHRAGNENALLGTFRADSARVDGRELLAVVDCVPEQTAVARGIEPYIQEIASGHRPSVSIGYDIHARQITEYEDQPDDHLLVDWEPMEGSSVLVPADPDAGVRGRDGSRQELTPEVKAALVASGHAQIINPPTPTASAPHRRKEEDPSMGDKKQTDPKDLDAVREQARLAGLAAGRREWAERNAALSLTVKHLGLDPTDAVVRAIVDQKHDTAGGESRQLTTSEARDKLVELRAQRDDQANVTPVHSAGAEVGQTERMKRGAAMHAALCARAHLPTDKDGDGGYYRSYSLFDMAREALVLEHGDTAVRGLSRENIALEAMKLGLRDAGLPGQRAHSTSDFPYILANVANKALQKGYETENRDFWDFVVRGTAPDYRAQAMPILDGVTDIKDVTQNGQYQEATVKEGNESWAVVRRGVIVTLPPEVIMNDNLSAMTRVPQLLGGAAARKENDIVWAIFTANAALGEDGVTLFHADHGNLVASGGAPSKSQLGALRKLALKQTSRAGDYLTLDLPFILLPVALMDTVQGLVDPDLNPSSPANSSGAWVRARKYIFQPRLDASSEVKYYGVADPNVIGTIIAGYQAGAEGVSISQEIDFNSDGLKLKAVHKFGAAAMGHRGLYRNNGV